MKKILIHTQLLKMVVLLNAKVVGLISMKVLNVLIMFIILMVCILWLMKH